MMIDASIRIRIARPSRDLAAAEAFYVQGLGLDVLWRTSEHVQGEHDLLMVGPAGGAWHLELTHDPDAPLEPTPTVDDLLVLYLAAPIDQALLDRLISTGGVRVQSHNPYWDAHGLTLTDPDGYRLVLSARSWNP